MSDELDFLKQEANKLQAVLTENPNDQYREAELKKVQKKILFIEKAQAREE